MTRQLGIFGALRILPALGAEGSAAGDEGGDGVGGAENPQRAMQPEGGRHRRPRRAVSAQRLFGRLERYEPDLSGATRPSHRWSSPPASDVEPPRRAVKLRAVRVEPRPRRRRWSALRRLQRARRRSTGARVRNRIPQDQGDDDGGHDAPRRHRQQNQDNEQIQRVLPPARRSMHPPNVDPSPSDLA